jgi:hypothetical protein
MTIDEPISALQSLNASDERQRSPISRFAKPFLVIARQFAPGGDLTLGGIESVIDWLNDRAERNCQELVDVMAEELKYCGRQIKALVDQSEAHRRFMADEMPGLLLDGLRRAEQVRKKDRIHRLARILVHAVEVGPREPEGADVAEEMMRIAMELAERDLIALREMKEAYSLQGFGPGPERYLRHTAAGSFVKIKWDQLGFSEQKLESVCCKLQSFGLLGRLDEILAHDNPIPRWTANAMRMNYCARC